MLASYDMWLTPPPWLLPIGGSADASQGLLSLLLSISAAKKEVDVKQMKETVEPYNATTGILSHPLSKFFFPRFLKFIEESSLENMALQVTIQADKEATTHWKTSNAAALSKRRVIKRSSFESAVLFDDWELTTGVPCIRTDIPPDLRKRVRGGYYYVKDTIKKWDGKRFSKCCVAKDCFRLSQGRTLFCKRHHPEPEDVAVGVKPSAFSKGKFRIPVVKRKRSNENEEQRVTICKNVIFCS